MIPAARYNVTVKGLERMSWDARLAHSGSSMSSPASSGEWDAMEDSIKRIVRVAYLVLVMALGMVLDKATTVGMARDIGVDRAAYRLPCTVSNFNRGWPDP